MYHEVISFLVIEPQSLGSSKRPPNFAQNCALTIDPFNVTEQEESPRWLLSRISKHNLLIILRRNL
jgi:hypothetical protein